MTRIIAGAYGGRRLQAPPGDGTRPTTDRVREALFSSLQSEFGSLDGLRFLDLFSGSGAIGLEAASRGASHVDLVENDRRAAHVIAANISELKCQVAKLRTQPVERFVQDAPKAPYDVIFLDPPYAFDRSALEGLLRAISAAAWLAAGGVVVIERSRRDDFSWPEPLAARRDKKYGDTVLWYGH
ncbi:MAG: 16S rRNA (guanine(966)-N(2))-methyltransferase RsmD [Aeromicrobium sp.]